MLLVALPGYAQEKPDIVPNTIKFFRDIFNRKNSFVRGEFESTEEFNKRRGSWDPNKVFYLALSAEPMMKTYAYDADKELVSVFGGSSTSRSISSGWDAIEASYEMSLPRYERRRGEYGPESVRIVEFYRFLLLPENAPGLLASKAWNQPTPNGGGLDYDEDAGMHAILARFPLKRADAKQVAPNLRVVLAVSFPGWDSFSKDGLEVSNTGGNEPTEYRTYSAVARVKVRKVLVVDGKTGNVWKTIPVNAEVAAAPDAKSPTRTLQPEGTEPQKTAPKPEPGRVVRSSASAGSTDPELQLSQGGIGVPQRIRRGDPSLIEEGAGSARRKLIETAPGASIAMPAGATEPEATSSVIAISDFSAWLDAFAARPKPAPRGEFETTEEYNRRAATYADPNQIYTVTYAPGVHPEKSFTYDADVEELVLQGSKFTSIESDHWILQQSADKKKEARLDALRIIGLPYGSVGSSERGGRLYRSMDKGLTVEVKLPRDKAQEQAKNLRLRLGFQVPDLRAAVTESFEFVEVAGADQGASRVRFVQARLLFVEIFHILSGEVITKISAIPTRTDISLRRGIRSGGVALSAEPIRARGGMGRLAGTAGDDVGSAARRSRNARPTFEPALSLTDELKQRKLNAEITANIEVDVDGSHSEEILTGSGDDEVDALILKTMKEWKWSPAIVDGSPKKQKFRYQFTINVK